MQSGDPFRLNCAFPADFNNIEPMHRSPSCFVLRAGLAGVFCFTALSAQQYIPINLGVAPGFTTSDAFDVNNSLEVTGNVTIGGSDPRAYIWLPAPKYGLPAGMTVLGTLPGGYWSFGDAINDCGQVVGQSTLPSGAHGYVWQNGVMYDLGSLAGPAGFSNANDNNNRGLIVGSSDDSLTFPIETHAFATCRPCFGPSLTPQQGQVVVAAQPVPVCPLWDLGTLGGPWASAFGTNEGGNIVGESRLLTPPGVFITHGFYADGPTATMVDLGTLPNSLYSGASAINDRPVIVGSANVDDPVLGFHQRNVAWRRVGSGWSIVDLGTFNGHTYNTPTDINNDNWIIGRSYSPGTIPEPFLWISGTYYNVNNLLIGGGGIYIEDALGMNENGDIAAYGQDASGQGRAFLLIRV